MLQQRRKSDNKIWWSIIQLDDDQNTSKFSFKFNFSDISNEFLSGRRGVS